MMHEIWGDCLVKLTNHANIGQKGKRTDATPLPYHRMQAKSEGFDCRTILVHMRDDMNNVTGPLRRLRHRQPMEHKIPVLGDEIDENCTSSRQSLAGGPKPLIFSLETALCQ